MRGDLYQTILKHGFLYYLATCTLNIVTMGFYFSCVPSDFLSEVISLTPPYQSDRSQRTLNGIASWFAWILPSMLSCSLLLALRHVSSPTHTEFMHRVNAAVDEALEMVGPAPSVAPRGEDGSGVEYEYGTSGIGEEILLRNMPRLSSSPPIDEEKDEPKSPDARTPLKRGSIEWQMNDV